LSSALAVSAKYFALAREQTGMRTTQRRYRLLAEMDDETGIPTGVIKWLGLNPLPGWTEEAMAIEFDSEHGIREFYRNGKGYSIGLYRPKRGTVMLVERVVRTTVVQRARRLKPD